MCWRHTMDMARRRKDPEPLDLTVQSECEDVASSEDHDEEVSEVETDHLEYNSDSCEDESGGEIDEEGVGWISKNKKITWSPTDDESFRYIPAARGFVPGHTRYASARICDPTSSFAMLLTDQILQHIVAMTNLRGKRLKTDWQDLDTDELQAYVGLLILSGIYRSKNESTLSLWSENSGRRIFRDTMSFDRFQQINTTLCFDDKLSRCRDDKLAPFRKVWDLWTYILPMLFNPDTDICVDELLVPFRGKCSFRQYMPKKPAKYGIKIRTVCDVNTSYAWRLQIYTGKAADGAPEVNQGMRVVLDMTEDLEGHVVTCDNFFTSFALAEELLKRKLALVGKIDHNKPELPPELLQIREREVFSSTFAFTHTHTLVSYIPRRYKNVLFLSTKHRNPDTSQDLKKKPVIIKDYNRCKGGVDSLDKVVGTYSCRRITRRWPQALFHNLIDVSLHNAFVLWTSINPSWQKKKPHKRRLFIEEVGETLVTPHMNKRGCPPEVSAAVEFVRFLRDVDRPGGASGRGHCTLCTVKRRIRTTCDKCGNHACKDHMALVCKKCDT